MLKQITFLADEETQAKLAYVDCLYHGGGASKKARTRAETIRKLIEEAYKDLAGDSDAYTQFLQKKE